jgi:hypothetical protein
MGATSITSIGPCAQSLHGLANELLVMILSLDNRSQQLCYPDLQQQNAVTLPMSLNRIADWVARTNRLTFDVKIHDDLFI